MVALIKIENLMVEVVILDKWLNVPRLLHLLT